ncbi:MAG: hypothetical protein NZ556_05790 [Fimbriimonadales bacterium]|nr:hypothetical protein [Fimbriimonadales bacterium]
MAEWYYRELRERARQWNRGSQSQAVGGDADATETFVGGDADATGVLA